MMPDAGLQRSRWEPSLLVLLESPNLWAAIPVPPHWGQIHAGECMSRASASANHRAVLSAACFESRTRSIPEFMAAASHVDGAELGLGLVRRDDAAPQLPV